MSSKEVNPCTAPVATPATSPPPIPFVRDGAELIILILLTHLIGVIVMFKGCSPAFLNTLPHPPLES